MENNPHERLSRALLGALRPLIRAVLRFGISYIQFAEICKQAFVDAATEDYGLRSRPTNISRVAVITGLSRKEVARIRGRAALATMSSMPKRNVAAEVLNCWHTDPIYLNELNEPITLPFSADGPSFISLVRHVAGDIPPGALRVELIRAGAVGEDSSGNLHALRRHFVPSDVDAKFIEGINLGMRTLAGTIAHNSDVGNATALRFQRVVQSSEIPVHKCAELRERITDSLARLTLEIDDYLASNQKSPGLISKDSLRIGVGVHYFEESDDQS